MNCSETECPRISGEIFVQNLQTLFFEEYVIPERPEKLQVENELNISLKEHKSFQFGPRRLSYSEKNDLKNILNWLIEWRIKPRESKYASLIILVKKTNGQTHM